MSKVRVEAEVVIRYHEINRERTTPQDLERVVQRKLEEALKAESDEVSVTVHAQDG